MLYCAVSRLASLTMSLVIGFLVLMISAAVEDLLEYKTLILTVVESE